jgi:hypothetical protein
MQVQSTSPPEAQSLTTDMKSHDQKITIRRIQTLFKKGRSKNQETQKPGHI